MTNWSLMAYNNSLQTEGGPDTASQTEDICCLCFISEYLIYIRPCSNIKKKYKKIFECFKIGVSKGEGLSYYYS